MHFSKLKKKQKNKGYITRIFVLFRFTLMLPPIHASLAFCTVRSGRFLPMTKKKKKLYKAGIYTCNESLQKIKSVEK